MNADDWEQDRWENDNAALFEVDDSPKKSLWERVCEFTQDMGAALVDSRKCPACGRSCSLSQGRHSRRWFWTHDYFSECQNDRTGRRIHFDTREAALNAEHIFKAF